MDLEWMVNAVMLAFCSIQDIREKEVSLWKLKIYGILAAAVSIWKLFSPKDDLPVLIFRLLPACFQASFSLFWPESPGKLLDTGMGWFCCLLACLWDSGNVSVSFLLGFLGYSLPQSWPFCFLAERKVWKSLLSPFYSQDWQVDIFG